MLSDGEGNNRRPAYSPDGTRIAFESDRDGAWNLYLMDTDGRNTVKLTRNPRGSDNRFPSCCRVHWQSPQSERCRYLGEFSNAPATRGDVNELGGDI